MSRKPPTTTGRGLIRAPSSSILNSMPPPKLPVRGPNALSSSTLANRGDRATDDQKNGSRATSPNRAGKENARRIVSGERLKHMRSATEIKEKGMDDSGEMNIQVIVRCR